MPWDFNGTLLAISDDWYFLDRIANRIIELHGDELSEYSGNYSTMKFNVVARRPQSCRAPAGLALFRRKKVCLLRLL